MPLQLKDRWAPRPRPRRLKGEVVKESRLDLIAVDLADRIDRAPASQQRAAALAACRFALDRTGLDDRIVKEGMNALERGGYPNVLLQEKLTLLVEALDEIQWDLQEKVDAGRADQAEYLAAFSRARAAHAVYFALDPDPFVAAVESVYEANAATDDLPGLRQAVTAALG